MKKLLTTLFAAVALVLAAPALAVDDGHGHGDGHGHAADAHGAGTHGGDAQHGADHGDDAGHGAAHDGHEGGHHHVYFSHDDDGDGKPNWMDFDNGDAGMTDTPLFKMLIHAVNLALFLGVVFWFARRPIMDGLASRALGIRKELDESAKVRDEARVRNEALGERLGKLEAEIAAMRDKAEADALLEETKLVERAEGEAERIAAAAQRSIRDEVQRARFALKRDAVALAVQLAESTLKEQMSADHHQQLAREFLDSLKEDSHV